MTHRLEVQIMLDGRVLIHQGGDHIELADQDEIQFLDLALDCASAGTIGVLIYEGRANHDAQD